MHGKKLEQFFSPFLHMVCIAGFLDETFNQPRLVMEQASVLQWCHHARLIMPPGVHL